MNTKPSTTRSARPSPFAFISARRKNAKSGETQVDDDPDDDTLEDEDLADDPGDDDATRARKKARRAKKARADDEKDEEDEADPDARAARQRERDRVAAILGSPIVASGGAPIRSAALYAALETSMPRAAAIKTLGMLCDATPGQATRSGAFRTPSSPRGTVAELYPDSECARAFPNTAKGRADYAKASAARAEAIVEAGQMARGERPIPFRHNLTEARPATAQGILAAGARARGEQPGARIAGPVQPSGSATAEQIIAAGKKARGEA